MKENHKNSCMHSLAKSWAPNENSVWLASTITLHRNIEKFKFPNKLDTERKKQIIALVGKEHLALEPLVKPILYKAEDLSLTEKEYLVEHFLTLRSFHASNAGEAFVIDSTGEFLTTFNIDDHLVFEKIDHQGDLETSWNQLVKIETALGKVVSYSYSQKYGFLTSIPTSCGTALAVTVYLQLPALIHDEKIDDFLDKHADESLVITGIQGNPTEIIGDVLTVQNNYTLGVSEENIISSIRSFTTKIMLEENAARNRFRHHDAPDIKDKVSRAYGILVHSYQIEAVEALNAISLIKLGADLGWITGVANADLNQLFFNCRRAHLLSNYKESIPQEELPHKRAEFIHQTLKDVKLTI